MQTLSFRKSTLCCALLFTACFVDKSNDTNSDTTTATTDMTGTATGMTVTTTATTTATAGETDPTGGVTETAGETETSTSDPTAGDGQYCQEQCSADGDCTLGGLEIGLLCKEGRCVASGCADDAACAATYSGWVTDCTDQAGCPGQACIDIGGGVGKCATVPSEFVMCATFMQSDAVFPPIEGGADIAVCANTDYTCKEGACQNLCESDAECTVPGLSKCDLGSGACQCADDADCSADANTPLCTDQGYCGCATDADCSDTPNTPLCTAGVCGCATDADCVASDTGDTCIHGACGCSDVAACAGKLVFDGTTQVCQGL